MGETTRRTHTVVDVLGVHLSAIDIDAAVAQFADWIEQGTRTYVTVTGVHGVMESRRDPALRSIHNRAGMSTCDGMPMVWASRWAGVESVDRVYGPDLLEAVVAAGVDRGWRHHFYGGAPGVADELVATLRERHPGMLVAGTYSPPFRPEVVTEEPDVLRAIDDAGTDILWVGLSTPKQERWMALHRDLLQVPVLIGVGAAFDLVSGNVAQAPKWVQRSGFEWLYRTCKEPRRLLGRYLRNNPAFVLSIARRRPRIVEP